MPERLYLGDQVRYDGTCPHCEAEFKSGFGVGSRPVGTQPRPGSINICTECRGLSRHEIDGTLRKLTPTEESMFRADPRSQALFAALDATDAAVPPPVTDAVKEALGILRRGRR
jgi:phage terminase large subunit GpA-like protein